jgi:hypothetical protein
MEPKIVVSSNRDSLPVILTPLEREERVKAATQQAQIAQQARAQEIELKEKAKDAKNSADGASREMERLLGVVAAGREHRMVDCEWVYDAALDLVQRVRLDTYEVLETRKPTEADKERIATKRQRSLPGVDNGEERKGKRGAKPADEITGSVH